LLVLALINLLVLFTWRGLIKSGKSQPAGDNKPATV